MAQKADIGVVFGKVRQVTTEDAYDIVSELQEARSEDSGGCALWCGNHPELGNIYVVIPPFENSLILPIVIQ
jgi:hypothetical protein